MLRFFILIFFSYLLLKIFQILRQVWWVLYYARCAEELLRAKGDAKPWHNGDVVDAEYMEIKPRSNREEE